MLLSKGRDHSRQDEHSWVQHFADNLMLDVRNHRYSEKRWMGLDADALDPVLYPGPDRRLDRRLPSFDHAWAETEDQGLAMLNPLQAGCPLFVLQGMFRVERGLGYSIDYLYRANSRKRR